MKSSDKTCDIVEGRERQGKPIILYTTSIRQTTIGLCCLNIQGHFVIGVNTLHSFRELKLIHEIIVNYP